MGEYIILTLTVMMPVEHVEAAIQIRNDDVNNFLIPHTVTVNNSRVEVLLIFYRFLHGRQCKLLFVVVHISTNLHSHRTDQTRI